MGARAHAGVGTGALWMLKCVHGVYQNENYDLAKHMQSGNPGSQSSYYVDVKIPVR